MTTEQKGTDNQSAADAPVAKPVKARAAKEKAPASSAQRNGPHPLSWINLVLMLGLFALAAYAGWLSWAQQQNTAAELAVLRDRVDQAQNNAAALSAKEAELLAQAKALNEQSAQLQEQVAHNTDRLGKLPGAERQDWLLAEAEYLLRMANQRLQLERDWDGALSMLQAADNVLTETRNPRLNPVRATLAKEMLALRTAPAIDLTGAVLRVQALQEQITQLPWIPDRLIADQPVAETASAADESANTTDSATDKWWQGITSTLQGVIRIRERSAPVAAPLTPDQQYYLQQNMHLMLEQAQVALLRQQADLYQHSLKRVAGWLQDYLIIDDERTRAAHAALKELQQWNVAPALPDISRSLQQLQSLVEQQRRGTVMPAAADAEDAA